jgi:hypothetical protein
MTRLTHDDVQLFKDAFLTLEGCRAARFMIDLLRDDYMVAPNLMETVEFIVTGLVDRAERVAKVVYDHLEGNELSPGAAE